MAYDQNKDQLIKMYEKKNEMGASLMFSIFSYDNGPKKLGIMRSYEKKDGSLGYSSSGRLTVSEVEFFKDHVDEILKEMY